MRKLEKKGLWTLTVLVLVGISLSDPAPVSGSSPQGTLKQAIHWGLSADWLDPATVGGLGSAQVMLYLVHDALIKPMPDGNYTPCLAESFSASPDFKVYEFKLRKGVKFHNGDSMTAEDVIFSFWRYKSIHSKFIHERTDKVEAVNPHFIRFHFKEPFPDFLDYLLPGGTTIGWVLPKKYMEKVGESGFKRHPIGCGPYKFVDFVPGVKLVGEAFEDFWRKVPSIKRMEINIIIEPSTRVAMIKKGEVDIVSLMQGVFYEDLKKDPNFKLVAVPSPARWLVYMASQWDPKSPWADPRVRKAASLAIDRTTVIDIHFPGNGPIGNIGLESDPNVVSFPPDPYDPEKAKGLLAEAGYPKGFQGGKFYAYEGGFWPVSEQVANYWKAIGINVDIILLDRPAWFATRTGGKMKGSTFIDPAVAPTMGGRLSYLFGPGSYGNYPDIQALWNKYEQELSPKNRKDLIAGIQRLTYEKTMWIPLFSVNGISAIRPHVKGNPYRVNPLIWCTAPFEDIELVK